jgi:CRISPR-associated protein Cmr1
MEPLSIQLKTLTPLWTGGVDGQCDRLHETGLIGSLRWWYEALVRGLGGQACDPTGNDRCPDIKGRRCAACELFGCTGWARKFRMVVSGGQPVFGGRNVLLTSGRVQQRRRGPRAGGWYLSGESLVGDLELRIIPLREITAEEWARLKIALTLATRHAALGAKVSNGYGVVKAPELGAPADWLSDLSSQKTLRRNTLPDIRDFFFAKFEFSVPSDPNWWHHLAGVREAWQGRVYDPESNLSRSLPNTKSQLQKTFAAGIVPLAPAIRNWLRYKSNPKFSNRLKDYIFGTARGNGIASKINISYAYLYLNKRAWEFRVWGWLPCSGEINGRDRFLTDLQRVFSEDALWEYVFQDVPIKPRPVDEWLTCDCGQQDALDWLKTLLGVSERGGTQ